MIDILKHGFDEWNYLLLNKPKTLIAAKKLKAHTKAHWLKMVREKVAGLKLSKTNTDMHWSSMCMVCINNLLDEWLKTQLVSSVLLLKLAAVSTHEFMLTILRNVAGFNA